MPSLGLSTHASNTTVTHSIDQLADRLREHSRWFVLTGAGVSTASGIPDYRDRDGQWKRQQPILHQAFIAEHSVRQRYWARSLIGWRFFGHAKPGAAHVSLAALEQAGWVGHLLTQNVDGLHQQAGSQRVIDLHGRIAWVKCMACDARLPRGAFQAQLEEYNPDFVGRTAAIAPDGDADLELTRFDAFNIPCCDQCGGTLMPDVVFFGGSVPKSTVTAAMTALRESDALLVVGSSLMVYSGLRFCRQAVDWGLPVFAINQGRTRADELFQLKVEQECGSTLQCLQQRLC